MLAYLGTFLCSCSLLCILMNFTPLLAFPIKLQTFIFTALVIFTNSLACATILPKISFCLGTRINQEPTMDCVQMEHRCWVRIKNRVKMLDISFWRIPAKTAILQFIFPTRQYFPNFFLHCPKVLIARLLLLLNIVLISMFLL